RRINAPDSSTRFGPRQGGVTSAHLKEALEIGAAEFGWEEKRARSGQRNGSKVIGVGIGQAFHTAGASGFDGLVVLKPDGKLHIHTGVGNLGTFSYAATARVAANTLKCRWENCVVERGDSSKHLPWNLGQFGSNTSFTMSRTNYAAAMDAVAKLKEIAAMDLGGEPDDYDIEDERVFRIDDPDTGMTYAEAAQRAIELGGKFAGHEVPSDLNDLTKAAAAGVAGTGLVGVAKDNLALTGTVPALAAGFIEIELDVETGKFEILDYVGVADSGTVIHPKGLAAQIRSGAVMGFSLAAHERIIYDPQNGLPGNVGLLHAKPASYLDVASGMRVAAVDIPDPQNPIGAKGIGEPVQGCAAAALLCAISDALGGHTFNRTPVVPDMIVNAAAQRPQPHKALQGNTAYSAPTTRSAQCTSGATSVADNPKSGDSYPEPRYDDGGIKTVAQRNATRRQFIKGVIASGAVVSGASYLFGCSPGGERGAAAGGVERMLTLRVNGQMRPVDVLPNETLAMTLRYKLGLTGTKLGCDRGECGACTVLIDDVPAYA